MKKISVIIPCYNVSSYIDRCMLSVSRQTIGMDSLEIICVDDASRDDTWEYLQKWERLFPHDILLLRQDVNRRQGAARNLGLHYASADWIAFVDADDWIEPDYLERLYIPTTKENCEVVSCGYARDSSVSLCYFDKTERMGGIDSYYAADRDEIKKDLFRQRLLGEVVWGKLIYKKMLIEKNLYFPEGIIYEDVYWLPQLYIHVTGIYIIREALYHYFDNPNSVTSFQDNDLYMDHLKIQLMKWSDYDKRGLLQRYPDEIVHDLLHDAITFVWIFIIQRYAPSFYIFQLERNLVKNIIPEHKCDPYIDDFSKLQRMLLEILYSSIDEEGFQQVVCEVKRNYI